MTHTPLNLARKWRSRQFDQVIGQELVVRLLKNSLYRSLFFPVYLFSGMRGCGKTTMARLFASALNCHALDQFMKAPQKTPLPCLECISCQAMQENQHPDFIELDAASHTGVENMRTIIDIASYIPIMGRKKIYLIDEAHMLSKAAFNALLKTLEEPPATALFLLATTDFYKIIDTVRSRCFQLFFNPLSSEELSRYLAFICAQESLAYESEALLLIAQESEGSVRDALNMLERVRLAQSRITHTAVLQALGSISIEQVQMLLLAVFEHDQKKIIELCTTHVHGQVTSTCFLKKCIELLRAALYTKLTVPCAYERIYTQQFKQALTYCSVDYIHKLLELCFSYETQLVKTVHQGTLIELLLLALSQVSHTQNTLLQKSTPTPIISITKQQEQPKQQTSTISHSWQLFLEKLVTLQDPLVLSIFQQARFIEATQEKVSVAFSQGATFFRDWLVGAQKLWQPLLEQHFTSGVVLDMQFIDTQPKNAQNISQTINHASHFAPVLLSKSVQTLPGEAVSTTLEIKKNRYTNTNTYTSARKSNITVTPESWPKAALIMRVFPGTVTYKREHT
jgi:DNA polymerase-3 subunit gamma/tau